MDGRKIDLLICCGDFQAVRNLDDLECMACPVKYRHMASFYKYFSGEKVAPYPTLFSTFLVVCVGWADCCNSHQSMDSSSLHSNNRKEISLFFLTQSVISMDRSWWEP